jgi:hypothetical protein
VKANKYLGYYYPIRRRQDASLPYWQQALVNRVEQAKTAVDAIEKAVKSTSSVVSKHSYLRHYKSGRCQLWQRELAAVAVSDRGSLPFFTGRSGRTASHSPLVAKSAE